MLLGCWKMIRFTEDGIFADTEEERLAFYDRMHAGDPTIIAHLEQWRMELALKGNEVESDIELAGGK